MECPVDPDMSIVGITHAKVRLYMNIYANAVYLYGSTSTNIDLINHELCLTLLTLLLLVCSSHQWYGAPPPMFCGPRSEPPHTGFWNYNYECKCIAYI